MSVRAIIYLIVIAVLLLLSAFFSACDMAFSVANPRKLKEKADKGSKTAQIAHKYVTNYETAIVTVLFGNTLVNILITSLGAALSLEAPFNGWTLSATVISVVLLLIILTFGEILPKALAKAFSYRFALFAAPLAKGCEILFFPIVKSMTWLAKTIAHPIVKHAPKNEVATDEELEAMIDAIEEEGLIDSDSNELLQNSIEFKDTRAYEVMTPRVRIVGISIDEDINRFLRQENAFAHSRIPVYRKNYDHIVGYLQVKTLQRAMLKGEKLNLKDFILPINEVPRTMEISSILALMKKTKHHIALVKDEYGGTEGIVTLEDILEELVGEMWDESEKIEADVAKGEKRNQFRVKGSMNIEDFFERFKLDDEEIEEDYDTVSGWITFLLGRFPEEGDDLDYKRLSIEVRKVENDVVLEAMVKIHYRRKIKGN